MKLFSSLKKKFRSKRKLPDWIFIPPVTLVKTMRRLMRTRVVDPNDHIHRKEPYITVSWHNRLLFFPVMFPEFIRKRAAAIISPSRDGQYVADLVSLFKITPLRGSSFKRGGPVLMEAMKMIGDGFHICFTPDGSRGPRYRMSNGPIYLASKTGRPIVPLSVNYSSYWELRTWDRFQIPKPWARVTLVMGDDINVPPDLDDEGIEKWRAIVEDTLMRLTEDKRA